MLHSFAYICADSPPTYTSQENVEGQSAEKNTKPYSPVQGI